MFARGTSLAENYRSLDVDIGPGRRLSPGRSIDLPSGRLLPTLELWLSAGYAQKPAVAGRSTACCPLPAWDILRLSLGQGWQRALPRQAGL